MRLDQFLVQNRGVSSRNKAKSMIESGSIIINGKVVNKHSYIVKESDKVIIKKSETREYVSRSALKLLGVLNSSANLEIAKNLRDTINNAICLDIGASTGGFTQVLLEYNASEVVALDVGHNQLSSALLENPKVINLEGVNFRDVSSKNEFIDKSFDIITCDVSFISLKYIIPKIPQLIKEDSYVILLLKPQFECGAMRTKKHKGAVINDTELIHNLCSDIKNFALRYNLQTLHKEPASIKGLNGNQEFVLVLQLAD